MKYELMTIKDIYDKIPIERVDVCMKELAFSIKQSMLLRNLFAATEEAISDGSTKLYGDKIIGFPDSVTWDDDDKGETTINIKANDKTIMTAKYVKN